MKRRNFTVIALGILLCASLVNAKADFCKSTECVRTTAVMLENLNNDVDPCENFFDFACGSLLGETLVPDEQITIDTFGRQQDKIDQQLTSNIQNHPPHNQLDELIHSLYQGCMERNDNAGPSSNKNLDELKDMTEKLGGWPVAVGPEWNDKDWSLDRKVQDIRRIYGRRTDKIIDISSLIVKNLSANASPPIRSTAGIPKYRKSYLDYIEKTATNFVASLAVQDVNVTEIEEMVDFELKLNELNFRLQRTSAELNLETLPKDFARTFLCIQWLELLHPSPMRAIESGEIDSSESAQILKEIQDLLDSTSVRTQANFLIWRLIDYAGPQLAGSLKFFKFQVEREISGRQDMEQQWKQCIQIVQRELPYAVAIFYIYNQPANLKTTVHAIFENVRAEFAELIANATWIDEAVREKLLHKLNTLMPLFSHPGEGFDPSKVIEFYDEVKIEADQYVPLLLQLRIIDADNKFRQTYAAASSTVNDADNWKKYLPPTTLNAFYSEVDNTLRISTSMLMTLINADDSVKHLNYATTGVIMAQEISHIVTHIINQANTWPRESRNEFMARKQCLIEQYSAYQDPETLKFLDGRRIVSENIADLTGIKLAYGALKRWHSDFNGTARNPIGANFTQKQLFWILVAQNWCSSTREEEIERRIRSDIYATERFRVIGVLQNSPDFTNDFECSETSEMNRANECVIW